MTERETASKIRGLVRRVTIKDLKDDGEAQTASIEVADGAWRENIEVMQQYGVTSSSPEDGGLALAFAVGGDEGDMVLLPIGNPSKRLGGMKVGDSAIYNDSGDRVHVKADGGIEAIAANSITFRVGNFSMVITSAGVDYYKGGVRHNGVDIGDTHRHSDVVKGTEQTGVPVS